MNFFSKINASTFLLWKHKFLGKTQSICGRLTVKSKTDIIVKWNLLAILKACFSLLSSYQGKLQKLSWFSTISIIISL